MRWLVSGTGPPFGKEIHVGWVNCPQRGIAHRPLTCGNLGGAEGIRTPDPLDANEVRYRTAPQPLRAKFPSTQRTPRGYADGSIVDSATVLVLLDMLWNVKVFVKPELRFGVDTRGAKGFSLLKHALRRPTVVSTRGVDIGGQR